MTNNLRRNSPSFREIKRIIASGTLGTPLAASWAEGGKYSWPTKSGFYFTQKPRNKLPPPGIMLDIGSHVVDLLCWWFGVSQSSGLQNQFVWRPRSTGDAGVGFCRGENPYDFSYYQRLSNAYCIRFEPGMHHRRLFEEHRYTSNVI